MLPQTASDCTHTNAVTWNMREIVREKEGLFALNLTIIGGSNNGNILLTSALASSPIKLIVRIHFSSVPMWPMEIVKATLWNQKSIRFLERLSSQHTGLQCRMHNFDKRVQLRWAVASAKPPSSDCFFFSFCLLFVSYGVDTTFLLCPEHFLFCFRLSVITVTKFFFLLIEWC